MSQNSLLDGSVTGLDSFPKKNIVNKEQYKVLLRKTLLLLLKQLRSINDIEKNRTIYWCCMASEQGLKRVLTCLAERTLQCLNDKSSPSFAICVRKSGYVTFD